jgi:hypothetical protein
MSGLCGICCTMMCIVFKCRHKMPISPRHGREDTIEQSFSSVASRASRSTNASDVRSTWKNPRKASLSYARQAPHAALHKIHGPVLLPKGSPNSPWLVIWPPEMTLRKILTTRNIPEPLHAEFSGELDDSRSSDALQAKRNNQRLNVRHPGHNAFTCAVRWSRCKARYAKN